MTLSNLRSAKLRLGLIVNESFIESDRAVVALTPELIRAFQAEFSTTLIGSQAAYDRCFGEQEFYISMEPRWAAPVLRWRNGNWFRSHLPSCPCYVLMSDPHIEKWREKYFTKQGLDYILGLYYNPFRRHFKGVPHDALVSFPWSIPDSWVWRQPIIHRGSAEIAIFGATNHAAYAVRNWCRTLPYVKSYSHSGVENKTLVGIDYFKWLEQFDAVIAAGSESAEYRLTTPKYFEIAAAGCLLFANETDDLGMLGFVDGHNCVTFTKVNFEQKAQEYLRSYDDPKWITIRERGRELILQKHTISSRLKFLEQHVRNWHGRNGK